MTTSIYKDKVIETEGLTFDDLLLLPNYADFKRSEVDLTVSLHKNITLKLPVISSPMDTVTEEAMAIEIAQNGGMGVIHRNLSVEVQAEMIKKVKAHAEISETAAVDAKGRLLVSAAVGAGSDLEERVKALVAEGADAIVVDSGHGHTSFIMNAIKFIKKNYPEMVVIGGNIATYEGAKALMEAGSDILRVGMGPGSICTTRIISGMGVPQLTAIRFAVEAVKGTQVKVIADGGIRQIGDMAKALAFGADVVMLGSLLSGFDESPGEKKKVGDKFYKEYRGMGSVGAMKKGGAERYGQSKDTEEKKMIAEGVEGMTEYKGSVSDYLYQISGSLKSSLYYLGSKNLKEFYAKSKFIKISNAGLLESHPHSIKVLKTGSNYKV